MIFRLNNAFSRNMFITSFLGIFYNPLFLIRRGLYKGILSNSRHLKGKLLDFGCGTKPYRELFDVQEYIGLDIKTEDSRPNPMADLYYDGRTIPFPDNHFDSIFSSEVFEHVFNLDVILAELYRVLKPGGNMLITVPFVWDEHEVPFDFARYTSFGMEHLVKRTGFSLVSSEKSTNYVETVFQMWIAYLYQFLLPSNLFLGRLMMLLIIAPTTILGIFLSKTLPKSNKFYHNNILLAKKPATVADRS